MDPTGALESVPLCHTHPCQGCKPSCKMPHFPRRRGSTKILTWNLCLAFHVCNHSASTSDGLQLKMFSGTFSMDGAGSVRHHSGMQSESRLPVACHLRGCAPPATGCRDPGASSPCHPEGWSPSGVWSRSQVSSHKRPTCPGRLLLCLFCSRRFLQGW